MPKKSCIPIGSKYGHLTVVASLGVKPIWRNKRCTVYLCQCKCGTMKEVPSANLGRSTTSCGCIRRENSNPIPIGTRFSRLVVISEPISDRRHGLLYTCKCDCGKEKTLRSSSLATGSIRSCGCLLAEIRRDRAITVFSEYRVAGTNIGLLRSSSLSSKNTSGFKGVSLNKRTGKWVASIGMQKVKYHLGSFDEKEEAALAYAEAKEQIHGEFLKEWEDEHRKIS